MSDPIEGIADTVDNKMDEIIGVKPKEIVFRAVSDLGPANLIHDVTGLPKPGELIEGIQEKLSPGRLAKSL